MYLTRYFLNELSSWVLFTPVVLSIILLIGFDLQFPFILMFVMFNCIVVFFKYHELRKQYITTISLAPIPRKTIVQVDFAFFSWVAGCYFLYGLVASTSLTLLISKEWAFPTFGQLCFLVGSFLCFITLICLFIDQNKKFINVIFVAIYTTSPLLPLILIRTGTFANLYGVYILCGVLLLTAISYVALIKLANKRLVIR